MWRVGRDSEVCPRRPICINVVQTKRETKTLAFAEGVTVGIVDTV